MKKLLLNNLNYSVLFRESSTLISHMQVYVTGYSFIVYG